MEPDAARPGRQALAVACSIGAAAFSVIPFLFAFFWGVAGQCDESCAPSSDNWRDVPGAWQWNVLPLLGGALFVAGICLAVFVTRRRPFAAGVSFIAGLMSLARLAMRSGLVLTDSRDDTAR
jgi:hypothetical protein